MSFQKHACSPETKQYDAHIFLATYASGKQIEFVVDDRYKKKRAEKLVLKYATKIGQTPSFLINAGSIVSGLTLIGLLSIIDFAIAIL